MQAQKAVSAITSVDPVSRKKQANSGPVRTNASKHIQDIGQKLDNSRAAQRAAFMEARANGSARANPFRVSDNPIQRVPADWENSADITRMLGHAHGWFSTWKKIKAEIRNYKTINALQVVVRRISLEKIEALIAEWEADAKHTAASTEQRVIDIRADMPILKALVLAEHNQIEDALLDHYAMNGGEMPEGIPDELVAGIDGLPNNAAKGARLFQNVNNFRFRYTGIRSGGAIAMHARQGDCETLAGMYIHVAGVLGIPVVPQQDHNKLLVAPQAIHGRGDLGNTEGHTHWYFGGGHTWVTVAGTNYDLLFMRVNPPASVASDGQRTHSGVNYQHFPDGRCIVTPGQDALNVAIQGSGRVFANEVLTQQFIDAHTG